MYAIVQKRIACSDAYTQSLSRQAEDKVTGHCVVGDNEAVKDDDHDGSMLMGQLPPPQVPMSIQEGT